MESTQFWTIIGVNLGVFALMTTIIGFMLNRIDSDVKGISTRVDAMNTRMDGHAMRIDQLYLMFVNLLKLGK